MPRLILELLDVVQLGRPTLENLDPRETAAEILKYRQGKPPTYNPAFNLISVILSGLARKEAILAALDQERPIWWRPHLKEVGGLLFDWFSQKPVKWYGVGRKPIETFEGIWMKPAIRGVVVNKGSAYPLLVNPRSSFCLSPVGASFLGRGVIEFHVRDDPAAVCPIILDLGRPPGTLRAKKGSQGQRPPRRFMTFEIDEERCMPLVHFEEILRRLTEAIQ